MGLDGSGRLGEISDGLWIYWSGVAGSSEALVRSRARSTTAASLQIWLPCCSTWAGLLPCHAAGAYVWRADARTPDSSRIVTAQIRRPAV